MTLTVEQELCEVTGVRKKRTEEKRAYMIRMVKAFEDLTDEDWDSLSNEAKEYHNEAIKAWKKGKKLVEFPSKDIDDDEDDGAIDEVDEAPAKKRLSKSSRKTVDDRSVVGKRESSKNLVVDEDDDADEDDVDNDDEVDEEEVPAKSKSTKSSKGKAKTKPKAKTVTRKKRLLDDDDEDDADDDDDNGADPDEDEDDDDVVEVKKSGKVAKRGRERSKVDEVQSSERAPNLTTQIKMALLDDLWMPLDDLFEDLQKKNQDVGMSKNTISGIAAGFRNTMKLLDRLGMLKEPIAKHSR